MSEELDIEAIEARAIAATPGPWEDRGGHVGAWHRYKTGVRDMIHFVALASMSIPRRRKELRPVHESIRETTANAEFVAHARTDVPALVAEVRKLREEIARMRDKRKNWHPLGLKGYYREPCPECHQYLVVLEKLSFRCDACGWHK